LVIDEPLLPWINDCCGSTTARWRSSSDSRVPLPLKVFVTAVAIVDYLGAVLVIALFHVAELRLGYLGAAAVLLDAAEVGILAGSILSGVLRALGLVPFSRPDAGRAEA
jgi:Na+/H+ antiporter NhaA